MSILKRLYEKINEAEVFVEHEPTHPEYPDFVSETYCYRIKSESNRSAAVSFVLPKNTTHDELGFNVRFPAPGFVKGGSQLSFLCKEDAEKFKDKYYPRCTVYLSSRQVKLMRIDNYSEIPCYVTFGYDMFRPGVSNTMRQGSTNFKKRLNKKNFKFETNPFILIDLVVKQRLERIQTNNDKIRKQIIDKLPIMEKFCSNITTHVDYKTVDTSINLLNQRICTGTMDTNIPQEIYSTWGIKQVGNDKMELSMCSTNTSVMFKLVDPIGILNKNNLSPEDAKAFSNMAFKKMLAKKLASIYNCEINSYTSDYSNIVYILNNVSNPSFRKVFHIENNGVRIFPSNLNQRSVFNKDKDIDEYLETFRKASVNIKQLIEVVKDELKNITFTFDDFDEEGDD